MSDIFLGMAWLGPPPPPLVIAPSRQGQLRRGDHGCAVLQHLHTLPAAWAAMCGSSPLP